ncbi:MAG: TetR/AcrR family transcriptional regulator [Acidobacteriota bacterium]
MKTHPIEAKKSRPRRGRPPKIDRHTVVESALAFELDEVSMRDVATRLQVTDAALYHYFENLEDLRDAMTDALVAEFELPEPRDTWRDWLEDFGHSIRRELRRHRGAAAVLSRRGPTSPGALRIVQAVIGRLVDEFGFDVLWAARAYSLVSGLAISSVVREEAAEAARRTAPSLLEVLDRSSIDSPLLRTVAEYWNSSSWDGDFDDGLHCILDGVAARLAD